MHLCFDVPEAREVYVAGDFNNWDPDKGPKHEAQDPAMPFGTIDGNCFAKLRG